MPHAVGSVRRLRFKGLRPSDPYYPNWLSLRRRVIGGRLALVVMLACLAWSMIVRQTGGPAELTAMVSLALAMVANLFVGYRWSWRRWPCPRCGKQFYVSDLHCGIPLEPRFPEHTHCVHCNLPEYAPD